MNCQSISRNQRSRGFKLKQGFKLALLLAVGIWLLYQIKHSLREGKGYGKSVKTKLNDKHGAVVLGRKGVTKWLSDGSSSDTEDGKFVGGGKKEDGGAGDDELDGKVKEISEEVTFRNKEIQRDTEISNMVSVDSRGNVSDIEVEEKDQAAKLIGDLPREDYTGKGHDYLRGSVIDSSELKTQAEREERGGDMEQEETRMSPNGMENVTDSDQQAILDGVHGFHDENGIPDLGNNNLISVLSTETISTLNNQSTTDGNALAEEVALKEKTDDGDVKTSSIIHHSEVTKADNLVSEGTDSVPSHHRQPEVDISIPEKSS